MSTFTTPLHDLSTDPSVARAFERRRQLNNIARVPGARRASVIEGPRARSVRATVYLRHAVYLLVILLGAGVTQGLLSSMPEVNNGGVWMLFSAALILVTGAAGTLYYPAHRNEIISQTRHFLFGISLLPGFGLAVLMWATRGVLTTQAGSSSVLDSAFQNALPLIFFATVIIPALIFVKVVAGMRNLHRSRLDDQEAIALWTRQDHFQQ